MSSNSGVASCYIETMTSIHKKEQSSGNLENERQWVACPEPMENDQDELECWNAFGDDDDSSSSSSSNTCPLQKKSIGANECQQHGSGEKKKNQLLMVDASEEVSLFLTRMFLSECASVSLIHRKVSLHNMSQEKHPIIAAIHRKISSRGMQVTADEDSNNAEKITDAAVVVIAEWSEKELNSCSHTYSMIMRSVVPGGWLLLLLLSETNKISLLESSNSVSSSICNVALWSLDKCHTVFHNENKSNNKYNTDSLHMIVKAIRKREGVINTEACSWRKASSDPSSESLLRERRLMDEVTIGRCTYERSFPPYHEQSLCKESIQKATHALLYHGVVVLRDLIPVHDVELWGEAVLQDLNYAISRLYTQRGVDLLQPGASSKDPVSYRELAMREDLRVDLRDGPSIQKLRQGERHLPGSTSPLRHHPSVMQIAQSVCNPKGMHFGGNFGRWNFDGKGPDGSPYPLNYSMIGAVVSLPGCADQAIHADTPHIFEHIDLPPHYLNLFLPATNHWNSSTKAADEFDGNTPIGGTAFLVGSHKLEICERLMKYNDDESRRERFMRLLRPSLCAGDALIFDCRVLHMGLANNSHRTSTPSRRPMLYVNITHRWFTDPKNWDNRERIFDDESG